MVETKDMFKGESVCWDDVCHLGEVERNAVILDEGEFVKSKFSDRMDLLLTIQMVSNKELFRFRLNKRTHNNLKKAFGTESRGWREKQVKIMPFVYGNQKTGLELVVVEQKKPVFEGINPQSIEFSNLQKMMEKLKNCQSK